MDGTRLLTTHVLVLNTVWLIGTIKITLKTAYAIVVWSANSDAFVATLMLLYNLLYSEFVFEPVLNDDLALLECCSRSPDDYSSMAVG